MHRAYQLLKLIRKQSLEMNSYDEMSRVLITDDVDSQCVDMLIANGFSVEKDTKLAKQSDEELIKRVQVRQTEFDIRDQ